MITVPALQARWMALTAAAVRPALEARLPTRVATQLPDPTTLHECPVPSRRASRARANHHRTHPTPGSSVESVTAQPGSFRGQRAPRLPSPRVPSASLQPCAQARGPLRGRAFATAPPPPRSPCPARLARAVSRCRRQQCRTDARRKPSKPRKPRAGGQRARNLGHSRSRPLLRAPSPRLAPSRSPETA